MRHIGNICCSLILIFSFAAVADAQVFKPAPVGGGIPIGPIGGGISGGLGNSGIGGIGNNPLDGLKLEGTLREIDPAPGIHVPQATPHVTSSAESIVPSHQAPSESADDEYRQFQSASNVTEQPAAQETDYDNLQLNQQIHAGGPPDEDDSDDDDSDEDAGISWWLWLLAAVIVVSAIRKATE